MRYALWQSSDVAILIQADFYRLLALPEPKCD